MKTLVTIFAIILCLMSAKNLSAQTKTDNKQANDKTELKPKTDDSKEIQKTSEELPANGTFYKDENGRNIQIIDGRKVIMVGDDTQSLINPDYIQQKTDVNYKQTQQTTNEPEK